MTDMKHKWELVGSGLDAQNSKEYFHYRCKICLSKKTTLNEGGEVERLISKDNVKCKTKREKVTRYQFRLIKKNPTHNWVFTAADQAYCTTCGTEVFFSTIFKRVFWHVKFSNPIKSCDEMIMQKAMK